MLTPEIIASRVQDGIEFAKDFADHELKMANLYRDSTATFPLVDSQTVGDASVSLVWDSRRASMPSVPIGIGNQLATNIAIKVASVSIADPDFAVEAVDSDLMSGDDARELVRTALKGMWRDRWWKHVTQEVALRWFVSGLGTTFYRWDEDHGPCLDAVPSWDFVVDPNITSWASPKWCARRIVLTRDEIVDRWGTAALIGSATTTIPDDEVARPQPIDVWCYWDENIEAVVIGNQCVKASIVPNLYGRVPVLFTMGGHDPGKSIWPIGDMAMGAGIQSMLTTLLTMVNNVAKHGGPMTVINDSLLTDAARAAFQDDHEQSIVSVEANPMQAITRIPGEQLNPAVLEAIRFCSSAIDQITGVDQFQRGQALDGSSTATESMMVANRSGVRGAQARMDFERYLDECAERVVWMIAQFGGPQPGKPTIDGDVALWQACTQVHSIRVIEGSTQYKDPTHEQQQALQLLQMVMPLVPLMAQLGMKIPNLEAYTNKTLRSFGVTDSSIYWTAPPPPPAPPAPTAGMPPDGSQPQGPMPQGPMPQEALMPAPQEATPYA